MINAPWRKRARGTVDYIDKDELAAEVQKCISNGRQASDKLASMFILISSNMLKARNFSNYSDEVKDEMKSYAQYKFMKSMATVDLSKAKNIFNYYSRLTYLAFLTALAKWKKR